MYEDFEPEDQPSNIRDRNVGGSGGRPRRPQGRTPGGPTHGRTPSGERRETPEDAKPARDLLAEILTKMGLSHFDIQYIAREEGEYFEIAGPELAMLIGRHGNTLEALNLVFNNIINAGVKHNRRYYTIDAEGYRARRADQLKELAIATMERVIREHRAQRLEPMLPSERKIVHLALAQRGEVRTESEGVEPERRVVIHPK